MEDSRPEVTGGNHTILDPFLAPPAPAAFPRRVLRKCRKWLRRLLLGPGVDLDRLLAGMLREEILRRKTLEEELQQLRQESRLFFEGRGPQIDALEEAKQTLTEQLGAASRALTDQTGLLGELRERQDCFSTEIHRRFEEFRAGLTPQLESLESAKRMTTAQMRDMHTHLGSVTAHLAGLQEEYDNFKGQVVARLETLDEEKLQTREILGSLETQIGTFQEDLDTWKSSMSRQLEALEEARTELGNHIGRMIPDIEKHLLLLEKLQKDHDLFKQQVVPRLDSLDGEKLQTREILGSLETQIGTFQEDLDTWKSSMTRQFEAMEETRTELGNHIGRMIPDIEKNRDILESIQKDSDSFKNHIVPRLETLDQEKLEIRAALGAIEIHIGTLLENAASFQEDLDSWKSALSVQLRQIEEDLSSMSDGSALSREALEQLGSRLRDLESDIGLIAGLWAEGGVPS